MFPGFCVPSNKLTSLKEGAVDSSVMANRSQVETKLEDTGLLQNCPSAGRWRKILTLLRTMWGRGKAGSLFSQHKVCVSEFSALRQNTWSRPPMRKRGLGW